MGSYDRLADRKTDPHTTVGITLVFRGIWGTVKNRVQPFRWNTDTIIPDTEGNMEAIICNSQFNGQSTF